MKHQHQNELKANQSELTADIFPVVWKFKLRAFEIDFNKSVVQTKLLNSLAYRLGKETNSTWCNSSGLLVTDLIGSLPSSHSSEHCVWFTLMSRNDRKVFFFSFFHNSRESPVY